MAKTVGAFSRTPYPASSIVNTLYHSGTSVIRRQHWHITINEVNGILYWIVFVFP